MSDNTDWSTLFCERCGAERDRLGDVAGFAMRGCGTCGQSVCVNCWNQVARSCLACVPFALPIVAETRAIAPPATPPTSTSPILEPIAGTPPTPGAPTGAPTAPPTANPTGTPAPTASPTPEPTDSPTPEPPPEP